MLKHTQPAVENATTHPTLSRTIYKSSEEGAMPALPHMPAQLKLGGELAAASLTQPLAILLLHWSGLGKKRDSKTGAGGMLEKQTD